MSETIHCPQCQYEIEVTEVLSAQLRSQMQKEFDADMRRHEQAIAEREKQIAKAKEEIEQAKQGIEEQVATQLAKERKQLSEAALAKAREQVNLELRDKEQELCEAQTKLKVAQDAELLLRKERRELEDAKKTLELNVQRKLEEIEQAKQEIEGQVAAQLAKERKQLSEAAIAKAREQMNLELSEKEQQLSEANAKLKAAQDAELILRKERRELEEAQQALELSVQRKLDEERNKLRETAKREALEERALKEAEKDKIINDLKTTIEELKRKSEQGSQQLQGEVLELALEETLRQQFPHDEITPVPKGVHGGDALQTVCDPSGTLCGTILWESKRTKNWNDGWLAKLRDDQRAAKAQLAILVSLELPRGVTTFKQIEGVWVTSTACAANLAHALRLGLLEIAGVKRSLEGRSDKMAYLYNYLCSSEFRHRVEGIAESFKTLREELEAEKRATQRAWAKREKQLERALTQTTGMYGDLQGIIGSQLATINALEYPLLSSTKEQD